MSYDSFGRNARNQFKQVVDALSELILPPDPPKRPIGFVVQEAKNKKANDLCPLIPFSSASS